MAGTWNVQLALADEWSAGTWNVQLAIADDQSAGTWNVQLALADEKSAGTWNVQLPLDFRIFAKKIVDFKVKKTMLSPPCYSGHADRNLTYYINNFCHFSFELFLSAYAFKKE